MEDKKELKMETKCYDANEYGYLYGLNQKIPDEDFEKVKTYMIDFLSQIEVKVHNTFCH